MRFFKKKKKKRKNQINLHRGSDVHIFICHASCNRSIQAKSLCAFVECNEQKNNATMKKDKSINCIFEIQVNCPKLTDDYFDWTFSDMRFFFFVIISNFPIFNSKFEKNHPQFHFNFNSLFFTKFHLLTFLETFFLPFEVSGCLRIQKIVNFKM